MSKTHPGIRLPYERALNPRENQNGENNMKYILMMNCPRSGYELMGAWPKKAVETHIAFMHSLNKDLREAGELAAAEGLADPRASSAPGPDGKPFVIPIEVRQVMAACPEPIE
jgi:hypothetical protein